MEETLFTKIINGEVPSHKIYEDEYTYAFLDIYPSCPGHTIVVHKTPAVFVWDLDDAAYQQLMASAKRIAEHYRTVSGKQYVALDVVGVDVPHNHVHIRPFDTSDELHHTDRDRMSKEPDHAALEKIAATLRLS